MLKEEGVATFVYTFIASVQCVVGILHCTTTVQASKGNEKCGAGLHCTGECTVGILQCPAALHMALGNGGALVRYQVVFYATILARRGGCW